MNPLAPPAGDEWATEVITGFKHIIKTIADRYMAAGAPLPEPHAYAAAIAFAVTRRWPLERK